MAPSQPRSASEARGRAVIRGVRPDAGALRAAFGASADGIRRYLFGVCGDWHEAEDLAQESLLKAWRKRAGFDGRAEIGTWLFAVARNHWLDRLRRHRARPPAEALADGSPATGPAPPAAAQHRELADALEQAMDGLPPEQREALALRESEGLTFRQTAAVLGVPIATAKSRVRYALLKLADELEPFRQELEA